MNEIASRYGNALFMIAKEKNVLLDYQKEVKELLVILKENEEFTKLLSSAFLSQEERKTIVSKTLSAFSLDLVNLIKVVIDNNRINLLNDILYSFNSYVNKDRGVDEGFLYSTMPLSNEQVEEITETISKIENHPIFLKNVIDTALIGGIKVVIKDHVYDGSIKNKLSQLRTNLLLKEGQNDEN